jgi:hypothetical protein
MASPCGRDAANTRPSRLTASVRTGEHTFACGREVAAWRCAQDGYIRLRMVRRATVVSGVSLPGSAVKTRRSSSRRTTTTPEPTSFVAARYRAGLVNDVRAILVTRECRQTSVRR